MRLYSSFLSPLILSILYTLSVADDDVDHVAVEDRNGAVNSFLSMTSLNKNRLIDCSIKAGEENGCETCVKKGPECFWCAGAVKECRQYDWYFPHCKLDDVSHKNCWMSWTALVYVLAIIGGVLLVVLISCLCYCGCRCKNWRAQRNKQGWQKKQEKEDQKRSVLEMQHAERSEQRSKEMDYYREKYGINKKESP